MKLLVVLALCALAAAAPNVEKHDVLALEPSDVPGSRNLMINILIAQLFNFIREVINNGLGNIIPPLDPLKVPNFHLVIPAGLINLDLELENAELTGLGGFVVHRSHMDLRDLTFDIDISVPRLDISTEVYDLTGDLLTAFPLYGKGNAQFIVEDFRFKAKLYLEQSQDGKSIIINRIEGTTFDLPSFKSSITGAIGGGDIDAIVNAIVEEVLVDYINRFHGAISTVASLATVAIANPILELLDTWQFIAPFLPRV